MLEEKKDNVNMEISDEELENVVGGYTHVSQVPAKPRTSGARTVCCCPKCMNERITSNNTSGHSWHCNSCGANFTTPLYRTINS